MKIKFLILFLTSTVSIYSQLTKTEKVNVLLIVESTNPGLAEFLIKSNVNSSYTLVEHNYDLKYGEYTIIEKPVQNDTLNYNEYGFLKFDYLKTERGNNFNYNYLDFPIQIGSKGEMSNKQNYKYKYNLKGDIIDIIKYDKSGVEVKEHYGFKYNTKNQISEILHYNGNSIYIKDIDLITYNSFGNIILVKNYSKTTNKNFPKEEHFKLEYKYNSKNQLISYNAYKTDYGYYWLIGKDLYKYVNGKKVAKSIIENQKDVNSSYVELQNYEYKYDDTKDDVWSSRIEYSINEHASIQKKYINIIYQKKIK